MQSRQPDQQPKYKVSNSIEIESSTALLLLEKETQPQAKCDSGMRTSAFLDSRAFPGTGANGGAPCREICKSILLHQMLNTEVAPFLRNYFVALL